jgi:hypothetical protein
MEVLKNKKILFIGPVFYDYHLRISNVLKTYGAEVHFIPEREYGHLYRGLGYISKNIAYAYSNIYLSKNIQSVADGASFDFVFVIHGETITGKMLAGMKKQFPNAGFINYHWDSLKFNSRAALLLERYDAAYSFDREDVNTFPFVHYKPLFHNNESPIVPVPQKYDMLFIGVEYSDRYSLIRKLGKEASRLGLACRAMLITSKFSFYRKKLLHPKIYKDARASDFIYEKIPYATFLQLTNESSAIIDINFEGQAGLTMRTIEVLAMGKKLITTNFQIMKEPFYSADNVLVIDRHQPVVDPQFFKREAKPVDMSALLLKNWVLEFFIKR